MVLEDRSQPGEVWNAGGFEFSLRYPFSGGWKPLLLCAVMVFLSSLVVPVFAVVGYAHHIGRSAVYGSLEAPSFGNFFERAFDGVMVTTVLGFLVAAFLGAGALLIDIEDDVGITEAETGMLLIVVGGFLTYVSNGFLTVHAATGSLIETFTTRRVPEFVTSTYYLKAWLLQFVVWLGVLLVGVMSAATVVGVFFWIPFALMASASYWGRVYKEAMDRGIVEPVDTSVKK